MTRWPDFIVAGSPKCGTTAVHAYLREQTGVFVPLEKEPHFFSTDIRLRKQTTREEYTGLFERAPEGSLVGEVSVWYLYSKVAASAIYDACGPIKVIAMLRNPVEAIAALHSQLVYEGDELEDDLAAALEANRQGRETPPSSWKGRECLDYEQVYCYSPQIERIFEVFGRERVHVILFDDLKRDTRAVFAELCCFLGVEPAGGIEYRTVNPNKRVRLAKLRDWSRANNTRLRRLGKTLLPGEALRHLVRRPLARLLKRSYTRIEPRQKMTAALRRELTQAVAADVNRLSTLIDRDLSHWLEGAEE